ncbi:class E sortase [Streptomyces sp. NPDC051940]|uniref:class E sortase n=1 Tax=Streptomyces sp. NPDC051940 TaxID=3155675 RepID=UPI0034406813
MRLLVRTFSELCITVGAVILLFVVYVLYWTGVRADSAMDGQIDELQQQWAATAPPSPAATGGGQSGEAKAPGSAGRSGPARPAVLVKGKAFAVMYIPRLGRGWAKPVLQGTGVQVLRKGLGHYARTAPPGGQGNFAVAGHRRTYGDPFKDFPRLRPGDAVVVSDGTTWFTYRIDAPVYRTLPSDVGVVEPVPAPLDPQARPYKRAGRYLTLTTCDPEWGSSHRLIAWGHLDATQPVSQGRPAALRPG